MTSVLYTVDSLGVLHRLEGNDSVAHAEAVNCPFHTAIGSSVNPRSVVVQLNVRRDRTFGVDPFGGDCFVDLIKKMNLFSAKTAETPVRTNKKYGKQILASPEVFEKAHHSMKNVGRRRNILPSHDKYLIRGDLFAVADVNTNAPIKIPRVPYVTTKQFIAKQYYPADMLPKVCWTGNNSPSSSSSSSESIPLSPRTTEQFYEGRPILTKTKSPLSSLKTYFRDSSQVLVLEEPIIVCIDLTGPLIFVDGPSHRHRRAVIEYHALRLSPHRSLSVSHETILRKPQELLADAHPYRHVPALQLTAKVFPEQRSKSYALKKTVSFEEVLSYRSRVEALTHLIYVHLQDALLRHLGFESSKPDELVGCVFGELHDEKELIVLEAWAKAQPDFTLRRFQNAKQADYHLMIHSHIPLEHLSYPHYLAKYENDCTEVNDMLEHMKNGSLVTVDHVVVASEAQLRKVLLAKVMEDLTTEHRRWESFIVCAVNQVEPNGVRYLKCDE